VVQAYLGAPTPAPAGADFAVRALAAFERVRVEAGGMRQVQLQIAPQRLRYWSLTDHAWQTVARGARRVYVGASSRDLPLSAPLPQQGADSVER
jgi:beta-glucosidase